MTSEEMGVNNISVDGNTAASLPAIKGVPDQLYLAFLSILLNLSDAIGNAGGGTLRYRCRNQQNFLEVEFLAGAIAPFTLADPEEPDTIITMEPARSVIIANAGDIHAGKENREYFIRVRFPVFTT
jgi:hypothetical protein